MSAGLFPSCSRNALHLSTVLPPCAHHSLSLSSVLPTCRHYGPLASTVSATRTSNARNSGPWAKPQRRMHSTSNRINSTTTSSNSSRVEWTAAVAAAGRLVGSPTSQTTLQLLLSEDTGVVGAHMRDLLAPQHPMLLETQPGHSLVRDTPDGPESVNIRGLLVLLTSRALGLPGSKGHGDILHSQRQLAEATEMFHMNCTLHNLLIDSPVTSIGTGKKAILCGDFMMANAFKTVAAIKNSRVYELMAEAMKDYSRSGIIHIADQHQQCDPELALVQWRTQQSLARGSLVANACQSALMLAGHKDEATLAIMHSFGRNIALALQARLDLEPFLNPSIMNGSEENVGGDDCSTENIDSDDGSWNRLASSLPVMLHRREQATDGDMSLPSTYQSLLQEVAAGAGVAEAQQVLHEHAHEALRLLQQVPPSEARTLLQTIVQTIGNSAAATTSCSSLQQQ